ncbi:MAG: thioredoxin domain-containing protein [Proteobacteria bacterium]|nr:thioredoxin domain-containing protein [Pseudomonadota bacterium]
MKYIYSFLTVLAVLFSTSFAMAQTAVCDGLKDNPSTQAQSLLNEIHSYGCCTDTVANCLKNTETCKTPVFVANEICRLAGTGKANDAIKTVIENRAKVFDPNTKTVTIPLRPELVWGNSESKVILSVYLCGRCPYCSRHVPKLIRTLENTTIKDKIAVNLRYFPIKSHDNSTPAALAIEAAAQLGQAWPYLIKSYDNFDAFTLAKIPQWVEELGMDKQKHSELMKDSAVRANVSMSKKEGLTNGVVTTPTFFLNGRKIEGGFDADSITSILEEALENEPK